jgi:hypothetical protein
MPDIDQLSTPLTAAAVEAILTAAGRPVPHAPALVDALRHWLDDVLERAIRRARRRPLSVADVDKLERAYERFSYMVRVLQDRTNPPPTIPTRDHHTEWEVWIAAHRAMGFKRGAPESIDWQLVGELLAFQEIVSRRGAITGHSDGPTMRFLKAAFRELKAHAPTYARGKLSAPTARAVGQKIDELRSTYFKNVARDLATIIDSRTK